MSKAGENPNIGLVLLSTDNPVFCCYCFWTSVLVLKMLMMTILTAVKRLTKKNFANTEDLVLRKAPEVTFNEPAVERTRRAHRNDLENVLPYLLIALAYTATGPNATVARLLFRFAAIARIVHTAVYAFRPVPQPSRVIAFGVTYMITIYMVFGVMANTVVYI